MSNAIEIILQCIGAVSMLFAVGFIAGAGVTTGMIFARAFWK